MSRKTSSLPAAEPAVRNNILSPLVALVAHPDDKAVSRFREVFEDVACDWRLIRMADGSAAARHMMTKGLPDLLVVSDHLPNVSGPELVGWVRSFRGSQAVPVLFYGEPTEADAREDFLRQDVRLVLSASCPREVLAARLMELVTQVEDRRFSLPA